MNVIDWIPAISVTAVFGSLAYFMRNFLLGAALKGVQHTFDKKLEELRVELRKSEEHFKSELRNKETQIAALRDGALTGLVNRRATLYKRRLEAVERIWSAMVSLGNIKLASTYMATINFDVATKEISKNPNAKKMFEMLGKSVDISKSAHDAAKERPFVSLSAWAYFSAYQAILVFAVMQLKTLEMGVDASNFLTNKKVDALIKVALPYYAEYVEKYGASGYHYLLDDLENHLLDELKRTLDGVEDDADSVAKAGQILRAAEQVHAEIGVKSQEGA